MQWNYQVVSQNFPSSAELPPWLVYRFVFSDPKKRLWANIFYYAGKAQGDGTYEQVEPGYVFTHPPRAFGFRVLERAPFPIATPGKAGFRKRHLELGRGWEPNVGEIIPQEYRDVGRRTVEVPAGKFADAWYVEGSTPGWQAEFWWVDLVGWARMRFRATDGRELDLRLLEVRQTDQHPQDL